eukprot:6242417-Pyramimonas_sp.AAC.1
MEHRLRQASSCGNVGYVRKKASIFNLPGNLEVLGDLLNMPQYFHPSGTVFRSWRKNTSPIFSKHIGRLLEGSTWASVCVKHS